ncbi:hypothetical protein AVEN_56627-1 [Araneus ventricosus]|uniref:Uncharacterized protein n=1 Tax=Araneus ventricosus TaxID=182803 RepID=A0A4Y2WJ71_ARAVE|nr:hypothetical protein AVEN_56627-1 [Araneus ventricosus]
MFSSRDGTNASEKAAKHEYSQPNAVAQQGEDVRRRRVNMSCSNAHRNQTHSRYKTNALSIAARNQRHTVGNGEEHCCKGRGRKMP